MRIFKNTFLLPFMFNMSVAAPFPSKPSDEEIQKVLEARRTGETKTELIAKLSFSWPSGHETFDELRQRAIQSIGGKFHVKTDSMLDRHVAIEMYGADRQLAPQNDESKVEEKNVRVALLFPAGIGEASYNVYFDDTGEILRVVRYFGIDEIGVGERYEEFQE